MTSPFDHSFNGRKVRTPVPIAVWRLDDRTADDHVSDHRVDPEPHDEAATDPGGGFASRLVRRLVLVYADRGDTVVDFDDDPDVRDAAYHAGCGYRSVTDVTDLGRVSRPVTLAIVRWPRPGRSIPARDLFRVCRLMMSGAACVITAVQQVPAGNTFAGHEQMLRTGAEAAGFRNTLQIVAINGLGSGDQFLYHATDSEAAGATDGTHPNSYVDLLVFTGGSR